MPNALALRDPRARSFAAFGAVALAFFAIDGMIARSPAFLDRPDLLGPAVTFDLTLGVTLAYWLIVVRRQRAQARSMLPVFIVSTAIAAIVLPPGHRDLAGDARYLGIPFEIAVLIAIVVGVRRARGRLAATGVEVDVPERIRLVLTGPAMPSRTADVIAAEAAMFYYALASWRRPRFVPRGATAFGYHRRNGYLGLLYAVLGLSVVEITAVDLVLRVHHRTAANVLLALGLFGVIWILGMARGVQLRPVLVTHDEIRVRNGIMWHIDIPRSLVAGIHVGRIASPPRRTHGYLRAAPGQPNVMVELSSPLRAHGPYGVERTVTRVGLVLDDPSSFERALAAD